MEGNLTTSKTNINALGFDKVWSGAAYTAQAQSLTDAISKLDLAIADVAKFDNILALREKYINICDKLTTLYSNKAACEYSHGEEEIKNGCSKCVGYSSEIYTKEYERKQLRTTIIGLLGEFEGIDAELTSMIDLSSIDNIAVDIFFDIEALNEFSSRGTAPVWEGSIFDLYAEEGGMDYINGQIANIVGMCSSEREIAVNVGLLLIDLCMQKGYVLDYKHTGQHSMKCVPGYGTANIIYNGDEYSFKEGLGIDPNKTFNKSYNNIYQMHQGGDCCSMVSYLVNVATSDDPASDNPQGFHWEGVNGFKSFGEQTHMSDAQAGDVFVYSGHTGVIVRVNPNEDNPDKGYVYILESGGSYSHLAVNKYTYNTTSESGTCTMGKSGGTMVRDMTNVYNGTQQNHEHMQGYHPDAPENNR